MSKQAFTKGPWLFEPHRMYGTKFRGETWPFGYLSQTILGGVPSPIFELNPILVFPREELEANARLIAAAPEMLQALERIDANAAESVEWIRRVAREAIAKAKGEA